MSSSNPPIDQYTSRRTNMQAAVTAEVSRITGHGQLTLAAAYSGRSGDALVLDRSVRKQQPASDRPDLRLLGKFEHGLDPVGGEHGDVVVEQQDVVGLARLGPRC